MSLRADRREYADVLEFARQVLGPCELEQEYLWAHGMSAVLRLRDARGVRWFAKRHRERDRYEAEVTAYRQWVPALGGPAVGCGLDLGCEHCGLGLICVAAAVGQIRGLFGQPVNPALPQERDRRAEHDEVDRPAAQDLGERLESFVDDRVGDDGRDSGISEYGLSRSAPAPRPGLSPHVKPRHGPSDDHALNL